MKCFLFTAGFMLMSALAFAGAAGPTATRTTQLAVPDSGSDWQALASCNQECLFRYTRCFCRFGGFL